MGNKKEIKIPMSPFANNSSSRKIDANVEECFNMVIKNQEAILNGNEKNKGTTVGDFIPKYKISDEEFLFLQKWIREISTSKGSNYLNGITSRHNSKDKIDFTFKEGDARSTYNFFKDTLDRIEKNGIDTSDEQPSIFSNQELLSMPGIEPFNPETIRLASQMLIDLNRVNSLGAVAHKGEIFVEHKLPSDVIICPVPADMNFYTGNSRGIDSDDFDDDIFPFILRKELEFPEDKDGDLSSVIAKRIQEFEKKNLHESKNYYDSSILFITPNLISKLNTIQDLKNNIVLILKDIVLHINNLSLMTSSALDKIYMEYIKLKNKIDFLLKHDEFIDDVKYVLEFMEYTNLMLTKNLYVLKDDEILISKDAREERTNYYTTLLETLINRIDNYVVLSKAHIDLVENKNYRFTEMTDLMEQLEIREIKIPKDKLRYEENKRQMLRRQFRGKR